MKKIFVVLTAFIASLNSQAQERGEFTPYSGAILMVPIGNLGKTHSMGIGLELAGEYSFSKQISVAGSASYGFFLGKNKNNGTTSPLGDDNIGFASFVAGPRFYFLPNVFAGAQVGYGFFQDGFFSGKTSGSFNYKPQIGLGREKAQFVLYYSGLSLYGKQFSHIGGSLLYAIGK